ncbi:MAG: DUF3465 domain-containing protein [Planctomycetota bacterium]|nr:DUF3465 domain-containing protein [Planctomycetota bacterium]
MAKSKKAGVGIGGLVMLVAIVLLARAFCIDLISSDGDATREAASGERQSSPSETRSRTARNNTSAGAEADGAKMVERLFAEERSGVMVTVEAEVVHVLPDDNDGSRHQRFLIELSPERTLLVAHNIDLAERVPLDKGDTILLHGQYEWSEKGGVLHWTHHDPGNRREGGWIEHEGVRYE